MVLGAISLVAANWDQVPRLVKMAGDLVLVGLLGWGVLRAHERQQPLRVEALLLLLQGLTLASIGLIAQTYHLGGQTWQALVAWAGMTAPALWLMGRSHVTAVGFLLALNGATLIGLGEWADHANSVVVTAVLGMVAGSLPLLHLWAGGEPWLKRARPALAAVCRAVGWSVLVCGSAVAQHIWYGHDPSWSVDDRTAFWWALPAVLLSLVLVLVQRSRRDEGDGTRMGSILIAYAVLSALAPVYIPHDKVAPLAALGLSVLLVMLAMYAHQTHDRRLFNAATAGLALRLLAVFVEVFGSLLATGVGLLFAGAVTLGVTWGWYRWARRMAPARRGAAGEGA